MNEQVFIVINTEFEKIHRYADAPEEVKYLRYPHRHTFYVNAKIQVFSDDREIEFILCKHLINDFINIEKDTWKEEVSCEMMAKYILEFLQEQYGEHRHYEIYVSEDNENGALVKEGV